MFLNYIIDGFLVVFDEWLADQAVFAIVRPQLAINNFLANCLRLTFPLELFAVNNFLCVDNVLRYKGRIEIGWIHGNNMHRNIMCKLDKFISPSYKIGFACNGD